MRAIPVAERGPIRDEIVDGPSTLEFYCLAIDPAASAYRSGAGWLLMDRNEVLLCAVGRVEPADIDGLYAPRRATCELLADAAATEALTDRYPLERAIVRTRPAGWTTAATTQQPADCELRLLDPEDSLAHVPEELRSELERARASSVPIIGGFLAGRAIGFSYCASESAGYADISIDVLEEHQRRGYGRVIVSELIARIVASGKEPVWGARETNAASLALGASVGFTQRHEDLFVLEAGDG